MAPGSLQHSACAADARLDAPRFIGLLYQMALLHVSDADAVNDADADADADTNAMLMTVWKGIPPS